MTNKATAKAHAMQGLLKYHGMKDSELRIPFHDSISVCLDALFTKQSCLTLLRLRSDRDNHFKLISELNSSNENCFAATERAKRNCRILR